jgi:hypothetical protein
MAYQPVPAASDPEPARLTRIIREIEIKVQGELARDAGAMPLDARFSILVPLAAGQKVNGFQITVSKPGRKLLAASIEIRDPSNNAVLAATADQGQTWESPGIYPALLPSAFTSPRTDIFIVGMVISTKGDLPTVVGNWATVI